MSIKDVARSELIGKNVEIVKAENKSLIGIRGKVVDETKNMLILDKKRVIKNQVTLKMKYKGKILEVEGRLLIGRPEDRIKKIRRL